MTRLPNRIHVFVQTTLRRLSLETKTRGFLQLCALQWALLYQTLSQIKKVATSHPRDARGDSLNELVESDYKLI